MVRCPVSEVHCSSLGTGQATKTDHFSEKFQTAFDPPPLIYGKLSEKNPIKRSKICNINFWIENYPSPPPLALFRKFIRFGSLTLPSVFRKPQRKKARQFEYFPVVSSNFFMYSLAFGLNHGAENFH